MEEEAINKKVLYRYENRIDGKCILMEIEIVRETEKSYFIDTGWHYAVRVVRKNAVRSYAYATKEEAAKNYVFRSKENMAILSGRLAEAKSSYNAFKNMVGTEVDIANLEEMYEKRKRDRRRTFFY